MPGRRFIPLLTLFLAATLAHAGETSSATTQPSKPPEGYRYLDPGSWIVTDARVLTNGSPAVIKRKTLITALPDTGPRAALESRWTRDAFEPTGPAQPLAPPDRRTFDQLGLKPQSSQPDQVVPVARKRYLCSVTTYVFQSDSDGRSTTLTLWRDKSGGTQLPPRTISINNREVPLPADALQADLTVDGPQIATHGQRRIVSLAAPLRVNNQTCTCLVENTQTQGTSRDKPLALSVREWFCHDLPGERLRTVTAMTVGPMRVESDVTVTDFHLTGPTATATAHAAPTSPPSAE